MKVGKPRVSFALMAAVLVFVAAAPSLRGEEPGAASISGLDDYAHFAACLLGPETDAGTDCTSSDLDYDGDVDLHDAYRMQYDFGLSNPSGMVFIPAGTFEMGDTFDEGASDEQPVHAVFLYAFYMDKYEVTKELWDAVQGWAVANGYDLIVGSSQAPGHPVAPVDWYDCVKWCNARSQQEGRTPCYYTDVELTTVYKTGEIEPYVKWDSDGYRLPTEAEWEKAAAWDPEQQRHFRFGEHTDGCGYLCLDGHRANYRVSGDPFESGDYPWWMTPVGYYDGSNYAGYQTQDARSFYGCYDMSGNVSEWCNDWYSETYYARSPVSNPTGPASGTLRVLRGGDWFNYTYWSRSASRNKARPANRATYFHGFRCVLRTP